MVIQSNCRFAKNASTPIMSKTFVNSEGDVLELQISGSFSSGVIHIEGRTDASCEWVSLAGINLGELTAVKGGFTKPGMYEIGILGARELRANIESISGGKVTVFG